MSWFNSFIGKSSIVVFVVFVAFVAIGLMGPGRYSLDRKLGG